MTEVDVIVDPDGNLRFIHNDDAVAALRDMGDLTVRRASHVEPAPDGRWCADLSPVDGPVLGPYDTRREALQREHEWLVQHNVPVPFL